jgi:hypothetical protein
MQLKNGLKKLALQSIAVLVFLSVAWLFTDGPFGRHKILGNLTVTDSAPGHPSLIMVGTSSCRTTGENDDITTTTEIVVRDGNAVELGRGNLGPGVPIDTDSCDFGFTIEVPNAEIYRFSLVGRGTVTYTHEDLAQSDWNAGFIIGENSAP